MRKILFTTLVTTSCWLQAQITLKKYDDPSVDAVESIVFEFSNSNLRDGTDNSDKSKKVVHLAELNPYKGLGNKVSASQGRSKIHFVNESVDKLTKKISTAHPLKFLTSTVNTGQSVQTVSANENGVAVSYSLFLYDDENDDPLDFRMSETYFFNNKGEVIATIKSDYDLFGVTIDHTGKYAFYAYNASFTHSGDGLVPGFAFYDIDNQRIIYSEDGAWTLSVFTPAGVLMPEINKDDGNWYYILDSSTGRVYKGEESLIRGLIRPMEFKTHDGRKIGLNDLIEVK